MIPLSIRTLVDDIRRYGTIDYDNEKEENGHYYRTTYYYYQDGFYDICLKDGEIISFRFISLS